MKRLALILAIVLTAATVLPAQQRAAQQTASSAASSTVTEAVAAVKALIDQRTRVDQRQSTNKPGAVKPGAETAVTPERSRDWEIDSAHLVNKATAAQNATGAARDRQLREVVDHALRMVAEDARRGNEDRELETYTAVSNLLKALVTQPRQ